MQEQAEEIQGHHPSAQDHRCLSQEVFETTIEKVIVGGYDNNGNANPLMLNFVFKSRVSNKDYIGKIDQSKIVKLAEFSCDYQHYVFEKTEK